MLNQRQKPCAKAVSCLKRLYAPEKFCRIPRIHFASPCRSCIRNCRMPQPRFRVDFISEVWLTMKCSQESNPMLTNGVNLKARADDPSLLLFSPLFLNQVGLRQNLIHKMYNMSFFSILAYILLMNIM